MLRRQLEKSIVLKPVLALYWQGITQNKEPKDYKKLKYIVENFLEEQLLRRNQAALSAAPGPRQQMLPAMGDGHVQPRNGLSARNGPRLGNALQVTTAPGQQVAQRRTSLKVKARGKAKARRAIGALLVLPIANVRLPPQGLSLLLLKLGATQSESEENLLQAKLIDLLVLGTWKETAAILTADTGTLQLAETSRKANVLRAAGASSFMKSLMEMLQFKPTKHN